jgi:hypothetical protein
MSPSQPLSADELKLRAALSKKVIEVMREVKSVTKDKVNSHQGYGYASDGAIVGDLREALIKNGLEITPSTKSCVEILGKNKKGEDQILTKIEVDYEITDSETGYSKSVTAYGYGMDDRDKGIYKAMTGAEKYFLLKKFLIPTLDDPENDTAKREFDRGGRRPEPRQPYTPPRPATPAPAPTRPATPPAPPAASSPAAPPVATPPPPAAPAPAAPAAGFQVSKDLVRVVLKEVTKVPARNGGQSYFNIKGSEGELWKTFSESAAKAASEFAKNSTLVALEVTNYARGPVVTSIRAA